MNEGELYEIVVHSPMQEYFPSNDTYIIGYEYVEGSQYRKYFITPDPESLAEFIAASDKNKLITSFSDYAVLACKGKNIIASIICGQYMEALYGNLIQFQDCYSNFHEKNGDA